MRRSIHRAFPQPLTRPGSPCGDGASVSKKVLELALDMNVDSLRRRAFLLGRPLRSDGWRTIAWFAVLLALPLIVFGIFAAYLMNADYAVTRTREVAQAAQKAAALGTVASNAIDAKADHAIAQIRTAL